MSCTYTFNGKTYNAWEFADVLASLPQEELAKFLPESVKPMLSKNSPSNNEGLDFAAEVLNELAFEDEAFRYRVSKSKTLEGNMKDTFPGVEYLGEDTRSDERTESGADRRFVFAMPQGEQRLFYVYSKGDEVWIDVSRLQEGDRGSAIYHAVANYAFNTGKKFVGDPMGLSEDAVIRRTSAMLSSALRFGTTEHLGASPEMIRGNVEKGIEPLDWRGDDLAKTKALIHTFVTTLQNQFPSIKNYKYDFGFGEFRDNTGGRVSRERLERGAGGSYGRASRAGQASLRRGIFLQSLISSESSEKPGILENVLRRSAQLVKQDGGGLDGMLSISFDVDSFRSGSKIAALDMADRLSKSNRMFSTQLSHLFSRLGGDTTDTFSWINKTISSQLHKARLDRQFGKVYNKAQSFIEDVARYATEAADKAPGLLPKTDTIRQVWNQTKNIKRDNADQKAIAAPIFEGTLYEDENGNKGRVWSEEELYKKFKLNARQVELYFQYRRAINHSLEEMAVAEMNKVARFNELEIPSKELSMSELAGFYSAQYADRLNTLREKYDKHTQMYEANDKLMRNNADNLKLSREEYHKAKVGMDHDYAVEQALMNSEIESLEKLDKAFKDKAELVKKMQKEGYAPLMRFGKYTVDVTEMVPALDDDGNEIIDKETGEAMMEESRLFFAMFDTESEARDAERVMREEYPKADVKRGTASQDGWQLFGAANPASLEALIAITGQEDELLQKFYKDAVANRSSLKRLIHRKGIAGYSEDVVRGLASFIMSNARATSSADHFGDMVTAATEIDKSKGDVIDEATKLINYVQNPNEEAGALRGLLFMQYLGGSVAAAAVNLTQTLTTTYPFLHQYGVSVADLTSAGKIAGKRMAGGTAAVDPELGRALAMAEDEGVLAPHNIHAIMGKSGVQGAFNNKYMNLFNSVWGSFFGMAEQFNRETAFVAAYKAAQKMGPAGLREAYRKESELRASRGLEPMDGKHYADAFSFAKNAVNETQFVLSKAARPNWARGAVGATLFTFKQFSVFYLELLSRLPAKERAIMLGVLILVSGLGGLPGEDDLEDLIDTIGQSLGYNTNAGKWKDKALVEVFGDNKLAANFVLNGVSSVLPLDVANRLGMGNLLPGTGLFKKSSSGNHARDFAEFGGAAGGFIKSATDAWDYTLKGRYDMAITQGLAPKAIKDLFKAADMFASGSYDDARGRRVTDVSWSDALIKSIGFQPSVVAGIQRVKGNEMQDIALAKIVKSSISDIWALGIHDNDSDMKAKAREMLADWNEKNPESKISIKMSAVQQRVKQMNMTASDRLAKTAPKDMREGVKKAFAEQ